MSINHEEMRQTLPKVSNILKDFSQSKETFRVVYSIPKPPSNHPPSTLLILDSSFNPPTLAHLHIATSALTYSTSPTPRLLLLLATQNADKASKPASFAHRLIMMNLFAQDLLSLYKTNPSSNEAPISPQIDIGITKLPYFTDKASSISTSNIYPQGLPQIHLIGFDTLTRLFSPKYYPPSHTLVPLTSFLSTHKLLVTLRPDDSWGSQSSQEDYIRGIGEGSLDDIEGKREWRERIEVDKGVGEVISSTRVREAAGRGNGDALRGLVTKGVAEWILAEKLYGNEEES